MAETHETKSERRERARHKAKQGMQVTGKYFWIAIANSQAKRDKRNGVVEQAGTEKSPPQRDQDR